MPSSDKIDCIQHSSAVAIARPRYSASVLDFETVFCFLELQETRLEPIWTQYPLVLRLSSGHPAQSASEYALSFRSEFGLLLRPKVIVCLRYRIIRLTAAQ